MTSCNLAPVQPTGEARQLELAGIRFGFPDVPLPDLHITLPGPDVPAEAARFSGVWTGVWDETHNPLNHILVVERLRRTSDGVEAVVIYAFGVRQVSKPGWLRAKGTINDGRLVVHLPPDRRVTYDLRDDSLQASFSSPRMLAWARMRRQPL
jgi:hypothetical protein